MTFFTPSRTLLAVAATCLALSAQAKSPAQWQALTAPLQVNLEQAIAQRPTTRQRTLAGAYP